MSDFATGIIGGLSNGLSCSIRSFAPTFDGTRGAEQVVESITCARVSSTETSQDSRESTRIYISAKEWERRLAASAQVEGAERISVGDRVTLSGDGKTWQAVRVNTIPYGVSDVAYVLELQR